MNHPFEASARKRFLSQRGEPEFKVLSDVLALEVSRILRSALDGSNPKYRDQLGYINWPAVEEDFRMMITRYSS